MSTWKQMSTRIYILYCETCKKNVTSTNKEHDQHVCRQLTKDEWFQLAANAIDGKI
jgi:hypothetical protein